ncbi:MAG: HAMP domain-containing protein [Oscillospiraceae bacterium]|nr:HAMP domain-containing protein [Oscillospiraceae bacterium]
MRLAWNIKTKLIISYMMVTLFILVLMNTYFLFAPRSLIFSSKRLSLSQHVLVVEAALLNTEKLTVETVSAALEKTSSESYFIRIYDENLTQLYSNETADVPLSPIVEADVAGYLQQALQRQNVTISRFADETFFTTILVPIERPGAVRGIILLSEADTEQGAIIVQLKSEIQRITVITALAALVLVSLVIWTIMRRITSILRAVVSVREGDYNYLIALSGQDELSDLASEFNLLTRRLRETESARLRFVADASHELKTPLASIRVLADSILQNEDMDRETVTEFVHDISNETQRLTGTAEGLMRLARMDKNSSIPFEFANTEMYDVVSGVVRQLLPTAQKAYVTLDFAGDRGCIVLGNADALRGVVFNLVENAIKYNGQGGSVLVKLERGIDTTRLTVTDTGEGVPAEHIEHIFERFYRVEMARSRKKGGSGLGLSIAYEAVALHKGRIRAENNAEGHGMTFTVTLPLVAGKN